MPNTLIPPSFKIFAGKDPYKIKANPNPDYLLNTRILNLLTYKNSDPKKSGSARMHNTRLPLPLAAHSLKLHKLTSDQERYL